ncbi:MAG: hypothetical protein CVU48_03160 [Candidatus Cloacimonetes bacterium HGW-Cloacimonetes-1]|jgi:outer membrane protein OmpA-like peptidoglycan-associated protein|nr:MAG: hypothetical protein CVU48_03160 [Candidatus Cloacimonetes bacterium HGW-Cloacimonetes-1]
MLHFDKRHILLLTVCIALFLSACSSNRQRDTQEERGMFSQKIHIRSLPTKAKIFINEREIGETPLTYKLTHEERRMFNIKAVPIYPNQYTQNIFLMVPPIPKTMTIYMNHYPEDYNSNKDKNFSPPEKPKPEIIVETEIDTVYIESHTKEVVALTLPIIYFDTAKSDINVSEESKLQEIADIMKQNQNLALEIYGFADKRASEKYNLTLTLNRANSVRDYLLKNGVAASRMATFGHGRISKIDSEGVEMDLSQSRTVIFMLRKQ